MPTYQYSCTECGHFFEQFQSFSEESLTVCPQCEGRLRKVFNAVGVVFKGSGFYRTDSRGKPKTDAASEAGSGAAKTDAGSKADSGTKSDAKPDTAGAKSDAPAKPAKPNGSPPSTTKKAAGSKS